MIIFQCRIQKRYNALALKSSYWQTNDPIRSKFLLLSVFTSYSGRDGHLRKSSSLPLSPLPLTLLDSLTKDFHPPPLVEGLARRWGLDIWLWRRCTSVPFKLEVENRVMTPLWVFHFIDHKSVEEPVGGRGGTWPVLGYRGVAKGLKPCLRQRIGWIRGLSRPENFDILTDDLAKTGKRSRCRLTEYCLIKPHFQEGNREIIIPCSGPLDRLT